MESNATTAAALLREHALLRGSRDNISIIVVFSPLHIHTHTEAYSPPHSPRVTATHMHASGRYSPPHSPRVTATHMHASGVEGGSVTDSSDLALSLSSGGRRSSGSASGTNEGSSSRHSDAQLSLDESDVSFSSDEYNFSYGSLWRPMIEWVTFVNFFNLVKS